MFVITKIYDNSVAGIAGLPAFFEGPDWLVQLSVLPKIDLNHPVKKDKAMLPSSRVPIQAHLRRVAAVNT